MLFGDIIRKNATLYPEKTAIVFGEQRYSWRKLYQRSTRFSNGLLDLGLRKGDRVLLLSKNSSVFIEFWFALAQVGMIGVTPNFRLKEKELRYIINDAQATAIIVSQDLTAIIQRIMPEISGVKHIIGIGQNSGLPLDYESLIKDSNPVEPNVSVNEDDIRLLMYTSGTTGNPKGAVWTHKSTITSGLSGVISIGIESDDINLNVLPLCLGGAAVTCLLFFLRGGTTVILPEFDEKKILETIELEKITATTLVPTMIVNLINHPDIKRRDLTSLKKIMYGSAAISPEVLKQALRIFKCNLIQCYGATEASGFSGFLLPEDHILDGSEKEVSRINSCGREAIWAEQRVVDEDGTDVSGDQIGEIIIKGDGVIKEYWNAPEKTKSAIRDGWWYSGDLAKVDEDGYIYIVDRKIDMIISGAINIYPREIENVLYTHPSVKEAIVIGVPDEKWGESIHAVIQLKEGKSATEEEIIEFCSQNLASYKKTRSVDFVDEFPLSTSGKILKRLVRERYWENRNRKV